MIAELIVTGVSGAGTQARIGVQPVVAKPLKPIPGFTGIHCIFLRLPKSFGLRDYQ